MGLQMFEFVMNLEAFKETAIPLQVLGFLTTALRNNDTKMTHFVEEL